MLKKIIAILVISTLAVTLMACGNDEADAPAAEGGLSGTITVGTIQAEPFNTAWKAAFDEFTYQTGVVVNYDFVPWVMVRERQTLELASGAGNYDVVYAHPLWWREFASLGYLVPIDEYTTPEVRATFVPSLLEMWRAEDGIIYGLPCWITSIMIAYRTDLFEEAGLSTPQSFADLMHAAEVLTVGDRAGIVFPGLNAAGLAGSYVTALLANDGWPVDDNNNPTMDSPQALETMRLFETLGRFTPPGIANFHWEEASAAGMGDRAAMVVMITARIAELNDPAQSLTAGNWDFVAFRNVQSAAAIDSWIWAVTSDSRNKEAAGALVKHLSGTEAQIMMSAINRGLAGGTIEFFEHPQAAVNLPFLPAMNTAVMEASRGMPDWETWASELDALEINMQRMFLGELTPEEVVDIVQSVMVENRR